MEDKVYLTFRGSEDTDLLLCTDGEAVVDINYCRARWNLVPDSIYISGRAPHGGELLNVFVQKSAGTWTLLAGKCYTIFGIVDLAQSVQGILPPTSQAAPTSTVTGPAASTTAPTTWDGIPPDPSVVSSYTALRDIKGRSELSKLSIPEFTHLPVVRLPDQYNGNIVFELPPLMTEDVLKKGAILEGMDRAHDCWIWTKMTTTTSHATVQYDWIQDAERTFQVLSTPLVEYKPLLGEKVYAELEESRKKTSTKGWYSEHMTITAGAYIMSYNEVMAAQKELIMMEKETEAKGQSWSDEERNEKWKKLLSNATRHWNALIQKYAIIVNPQLGPEFMSTVRELHTTLSQKQRARGR
ncbi:hypothetical protein R1sor_026403 [Riccia sorocarpa]|uniref:Uncharacterized protein n=1 Tax=Riccia sorocarpa TaxID=122646 RepID=A0ABD3GBC0_9MARC